jgi:hypothetical protein
MHSHRLTFGVALAGLSLLTFSAAAVTEEWSTRENWTIIYQVVADGKGGCAVFGSVPGAYVIAWYDRKGDEIYDTTFTAPSFGLYSCTKKSLSYSKYGGVDYEMIVVDKDGSETTVLQGNTDFSYIGIPPYQVSVVQDKKGYFVAKVNKGNGKWFVTRYSHK